MIRPTPHEQLIASVLDDFEREGRPLDGWETAAEAVARLGETADVVAFEREANAQIADREAVQLTAEGEYG